MQGVGRYKAGAPKFFLNVISQEVVYGPNFKR